MFKRLAATALLLSLLGPALAWAQLPPPADSVIKGVYDDIAKYQGQFDSNPSAATARRLQRLLGITEGRLANSPNRSDPSYAAAADALAALNERFAAAIEGRPAQPAPPAAAGQPAPAAPPVASGDPVVQAAAEELARISAAVDAMQPGDKANGQKYMNELNAIGNRLRGVGNKDAAWADVAKEFNALQKRVVEVANASAPAGQQPAQSAGGAKPNPNVERARRELTFVERNIGNQRPDDVRGEQRILADLNRIGDTLGAVQDRAHPSWQEAMDHRARLYLQLAKVRLGGIGGGLADIEKAVQASPSVEFLNPDAVNKVTDAIAGYSRQLDVYAFYKDKPEMFQDAPGLLAVFDKPDQILSLMDRRQAEARAAEGELGDVVAEVDAIEARMQAVEVPRSLNGQKITAAMATQYVAAIASVREAAARDAAYLQKIRGRTDKIDGQRLDRLIYWIGTDIPRKIDSSVAESQAMMGILTDGAQRLLDFHAADDANDPNHQANRFLGENRYDETIASFNEQLDYLRGALVFEAAFGPDRKAERQRQIAALEQAQEKYEADHKVAVGAVRLSKGVGDDELRKIAREVLTSGRYDGVGEIMRIETTRKTHREETRGSISGTATGASVTAAKYSWDEFQAHTVEKHGDEFVIYHSTIKYFYSGGSTTPLDRWLVSERFKSNPILEENIHK